MIDEDRTTWTLGQLADEVIEACELPMGCRGTIMGALGDAKLQGRAETTFTLVERTAEALDAERYRFLRNIAMTMDDVPSVVSGASGEFDFLEGAGVDEAVDEAIAEWKAAGCPIPPSARTDVHAAGNVSEEATRALERDNAALREALEGIKFEAMANRPGVAHSQRIWDIADKALAALPLEAA